MTDAGLGIAKRLPLEALQLVEGNPRRGRVDVIAESLRVNGQFRPIVVNAGSLTGREFEVLAGNHTVLAARSLGWADIDVWVVDVGEVEAKRIVAADNRSAEVGGFDHEALLELLGSLPDLDGTGYGVADLQVLEDLVAGPPALDEFAPVGGSGAEVGDVVVVRLTLEPALAAVWSAHRKNFDDDSSALRAALNL